MLPIALGNGTKVIGLLMTADKEYVAVMQLHSEVNEERLRSVISEFVGEIYQRPPVRSSVKRSLRIKKIYDIKLLEYSFPYVLLHIVCEHGTYVRKLIHDAGEVLGVGAHMRELRRVRTGPFKEGEYLVRMHDLSEAVYLYNELKDESLLRKYLMPIEYITSHMPKVVVADGAAAALTYGADLAVPGIVRLHDGIKKGDKVAILTLKGELVALGEALMSSDEVLTNEKGIAVKNLRVVMPRDTYPRSWGKWRKKNS